MGFPGGASGKEPACPCGRCKETRVWSLGWEHPLEEEDVATHSSILAWRIPWTEELGGLQSFGSQRVGHNWVTKHSTDLNKIRKVWLVLKEKLIYLFGIYGENFVYISILEASSMDYITVSLFICKYINSIFIGGQLFLCIFWWTIALEKNVFLINFEEFSLRVQTWKCTCY